ncbi:MAG: ABC transporter ATP-binding protein, partial [Candidatus Dojkabacteria bacterium]
LETLVYFGRIKGLEAAQAEKRALEYLKRVELSDKKDTEIKKLSSGQQQKIQLGITVINSPELLILDEPTKGLDPVNRDLLLDMLLELNKSGSTIVFSTHQMEEAEKIADRLVMIKDGKRALYGTLEEIKESFGTHMIRVRFEGKLPENNDMYAARVENRYAELEPQNNCTPQDVLKYLISKDVKITHFEVSAPSLHAIFVKVSKDNA